MLALIQWNPNQEPDLYGYRVYQGETSGVYNQSFVYLGEHLPYLPVIAPVTSAALTITDGQPVYFAVTALDTVLNEGVFSDEVTIINRFVKVHP